MNVTHCTLLFSFEGKVFARGNKAAADSSPFIPARALVLTLPPSADLSSFLSLLLTLCCLDFAESDQKKHILHCKIAGES